MACEGEGCIVGSCFTFLLILSGHVSTDVTAFEGFPLFMAFKM